MADKYLLVFFYLNLQLFSTFPSQCGAFTDCVSGPLNINVDDNNTVLTSPGLKFELGLFSPDNNRKYLGIWYHGSSPKIVVWVANRDKPLLKPTGFLVIQSDSANLLDTRDGNISQSYWSAHFRNSSKPSLCLLDTGNLILTKSLQLRVDQFLWRSFDHPTNTFLPGMSTGELLSLTSWKSSNDPTPGDFTLQIENFSISLWKRGSPYYSENQVINYSTTPVEILDLLATDNESQNKTKRLVMNSTGEIQVWEQLSSYCWSRTWHEPAMDQCTRECRFGSCNSNTEKPCKCLPGFVKPGDDEVCSPKSSICQRDYSNDVFLRMPMIQVDLPLVNQGDCETMCRKDCHCVAYSCGDANCTRQRGAGENRCYRWLDELPVLSEEHPQGLTIFVRAAKSDFELSSNDCGPCGSYVIPYPLSTAPDCGDPSYHDFFCNTTTGQVGFLTLNGTLRVASIDPSSKKFYIQIRNSSYYDTKYIKTLILSANHSSLYNITKFDPKNDQSYPEAEQSIIRVEIQWQIPPEPVCKSSSDCNGWAHTSCKMTGGTMRCVCGSKFKWDGQNLKCAQDGTKLTLNVVIAAIAGALAIVLLCGAYYGYQIRKRRITKTQRSEKYDGDDTEGIDVPYFQWESILAATNNFAEETKLGTGGFGAVYKGTLADGKEVAVKRLSSVTVQGVDEFKTEVVLIAKLQHRNLVRLVGYCAKSDEKILLYEFMPNGSLDSCLFDETRSVFLDWEKRFDIILGIARGLLYLHQDSRLRIIHRDLKPSNVLLDEELNAKISDFGIARIIGGKETEGTTNLVVGTYGYMSPEYAYGGVFSIKSDVFSFGVVVLETVSGRRNSKLFEIEFGTSLPGEAWRLWKEDRGLDLMDKSIQESCKQSQVLKCIQVGLLCVQEEPSDRPTMSDVVLMLSSNNGSLPTPKKPAFSSKKPPSITASSSGVKDPSFSTSDPSFTSDLNLIDTITMSTQGR